MWRLNVLFIERDPSEPVICRRLALGHIFAQEWPNCDPRWETIVLA
jgi:hypothetical protein